MSSDIDECAEGLIQCHNHSRCVNLPGWYHCECRSGFHDNGSYLLDGSSCIDVDECSLHTHTCWNHSVCVNLPGSYDCVCTSGPGCSGDCPQERGIRRNGEDWKPSFDRCAICSCKDGHTYCRRRPCDCGDPDQDLFCCPSCDNRPSSQCLDQSGRTLYPSGASWLYGCQQCRCLEGEVDCWSLVCPVLVCEYTAVVEGECCPRCVADPCLADNLSYDIRQTCQDPAGVMRLSGDTWHMPNSPCTTCKCKWRIETPLRVEPSPLSSTMEGSVHQPAVSQLYNTPHSPSHTWVELWPCTSCPAWDPLPSIVGSSTQRCLPFMGWRLDAIAEVKEKKPAHIGGEERERTGGGRREERRGVERKERRGRKGEGRREGEEGRRGDETRQC
ncbi:Protein kinase C-binding protein NELL1 NEL-like protein 1 [Takifugu flavidus]|uniref:Protein kinase C-binding protein NELL1 NEL-like protein 1 n=1 Tax=Takifugu flavidus TaxID=433684 RepID=A0A5C6NKI8_9TELE|nr:Protein kinase C-binding protein NELL1 NEL-like protein 1 [Takifugu flavidus]